MKLTRGKKIALTAFGIFLAFMAVCTLVAKGIYAAGLPRVTTSKPYSGSLTHVINADATVRQGQEYGIYVEPGLRVDTVSVSRGDIFQAGDALFRIEVGDLAETIAQRRLEIAKLEVERAEAIKTSGYDKREQQTDVSRAKEDYNKVVETADARIARCQQELEAAQRELALYDQYLADSAEAANKKDEENPFGSGNVSAGNGSNGGTQDGNGGDTAAGNENSEEKPGGAGNVNSGEEPAGNGNGSSEEKPAGSGNGNSGEEPGGAGNGSSEEKPGGAGNGSNGGTPGENGNGSGDIPEEIVSEGNAGTGKSEIFGGAENNRTSDGNDTGSDAEEQESNEDSSQLNEVISQVQDYEQYYNQQEKRLRLEQKVVTCAQALEEARRQKEAELLAAARLIEDAESVNDPDVSAVNLLSLDIAYQEEKLKRLEALLEADGWVYAETSGRVVDCCLAAGERVPDNAGILYAMDDGERVMNAVFTEEQSKYISVGTLFEAKTTAADGSRASGTALLEAQEKQGDGGSFAKLSFEGLALEIGQSAQLSYRMQTDSYTACISRMCLYQESETDYYIYVAEEQEGILGTEWKVRVTVLDQNDTVAAIQSVDVNSESRVVSGTTKPLVDGMTIRVIQ